MKKRFSFFIRESLFCHIFRSKDGEKRIRGNIKFIILFTQIPYPIGVVKWRIIFSTGCVFRKRQWHLAGTQVRRDDIQRSF